MHRSDIPRALGNRDAAALHPGSQHQPVAPKPHIQEGIQGWQF